MEIGEDITFGGQTGVKGYDPSAILISGKIKLLWYLFVSCYYIFLFERVLIIHMAYKVFQEYINIVSLSICPCVSLFICPSVCPFVNF